MPCRMLQTSGGDWDFGSNVASHRIRNDAEQGTEYFLKAPVWFYIIEVPLAGAVGGEAIGGYGIGVVERGAAIDKWLFWTGFVSYLGGAQWTEHSWS